MDGLARALRLARSDLRFVTLALDAANEDTEDKTSQIVQVMSQAFLNPTSTNYESEYHQVSGMLHVKRIAPADHLKTDFLEELSGNTTQIRALRENTPFEIRIPESTRLEKLEFEECNSAGEPGPRDIEVEVRAVGLNAIDMPQSFGFSNNTGLGIECAGVIKRKGADIANAYRIGDRVCMLGSNLCRSYAHSRQDLIARIPDALNFEQAAILPFHSWLASYLVESVAHLRKDDTLLVLDGMSTLGQLTTTLA